MVDDGRHQIEIAEVLAATGRPDLALAMFAGFIAWLGMITARWLLGG